MKRLFVILLTVTLLVSTSPGKIFSDVKAIDSPSTIDMDDSDDFDSVMGQALNGKSLVETASSRVIVSGLPDISGFDPLSVVKDAYGYYVIQFASPAEAGAFVQSQSSNNNISWAQVDNVYSAAVWEDWEDWEPFLPSFDSWGVDSIEAMEISELVYQMMVTDTDLRNRRITVAVLDTGCDMDSDWFIPFYVPEEERNFDCDFVLPESDGEYGDPVYSDWDPNDENGHGTMVASVIVNSSYGLRNENIRVLPIRVLDRDGEGDEYGIGFGIRQAADHGADVINLSLALYLGGWAHESCFVEESIKYAVDKGCVVCVAAGNDTAPLSYSCPGCMDYPGVVVVGAIDRQNQVADFSNFGPTLDVVAPGVNVPLVTMRENPDSFVVDCDSGTSFAAPHASVAAAFVKLINPELSAAEIEAILKASAADLGAPGKDDYYGAGSVKLGDLLPRIITQPQSVSADINENVELTVEASGYSLSYQWQIYSPGTKYANMWSWKNVSNGTSPTLVVKAKLGQSLYKYRCVVSTPLGSVKTDEVRVSANLVPVPHPDPGVIEKKEINPVRDPIKRP